MAKNSDIGAMEFQEGSESLLEIEKITGSADESVASSVFTKKIAGEAGFGNLVLVIWLKKKQSFSSNAGEVDLSATFRDIFEIVTKKLEGAETSALEALRLSFQAGVEYLSSRDLEASLAAAFFLGGACYLARHGEKVKILVFEDGKSEEIDIENGSGPVRVGQTYVVGTEEFLKIFDSSVIFGQESLSEIRDGLATEISSRKDQSAIAAVLVRVKESSEVQEPEEAESSEDKEKGQDLVDSKESSLDETEAEEKTDGRNPMLSNMLAKTRTLKIGILGIFKLRRSIVAVACIILVILGISVGLSTWQKVDRERRAEFEVHMTLASNKYSEGAAIIDLNRQRAREILIEADREVKMALSLLRENENAKKLASDISSKLKETEATSNVEFKALTQADEPFKSLAFDDGNLVAIAESKLTDMDLKSQDLRQIDVVDGVLSGFVFDNKAFLMRADGVSRVNLQNNAEEKLIEGVEANDISVFLGNVYLLGAHKIDKFVPIEGGYSDAADYLEQEADFGDRSRFAIDGSIWVTSGKKIYKFTRGIDDNFEISGLPAGRQGLSEMGEFGPIYTDSDLDNLYLVDVSNSAMLVIGKDGIYKKAYQSPEFGRATDLLVDEVNKKIYLSSADKILEAGIE